jgi:hypothetical protein
MIYIWLNLWPILAATIAGLLAAGAGTALRPVSRLAVCFLAAFWFASILAGALILAPPKGGVWTMTLGTAVVIWIGFVVPAGVINARRRGGGGAAIDAGYWLAAMLAQAVVLRLVGLVPPPA